MQGRRRDHASLEAAAGAQLAVRDHIEAGDERRGQREQRVAADGAGDLRRRGLDLPFVTGLAQQDDR
jgi:hypothetical protein